MGMASVVQNPMNSCYYYYYCHGQRGDLRRWRVNKKTSPAAAAPPSNCLLSTSSPHHTCRRPHRLTISCSKPTARDSERKSISAQPRDDVTSTETPHPHSSLQETHESQQQHQDYASSVRTVAAWVCTAVAFGVGLGFKDGVGKASEFFAGYILEQSLSVDNLFVFVLIFKYFKVPTMYQSRVLSYGIAGAVFFRLTLILLGTATLQRFEAVNLLLAAILIYSSFKLFASEEDESDLSNNFVVKTCQKFIPVTTYYDGNRFITNKDGLWKVQTFWAGHTFTSYCSSYRAQ